MKITYYMSNKDEILSIKDDTGNVIKEAAYHIGNCLIDLLYGKAIIEKGSVVDIDNDIDNGLKNRITGLLERCDDYLHNDIKSIVEYEMPYIFHEKFTYQNVFVENKLCRVYFFDDIHKLICLLLTNIYLKKLMYKRCEYCKKLFATRFTNARFCKRISTRNGKTCRYAHALLAKRKKRIHNEEKGN